MARQKTSTHGSTAQGVESATTLVSSDVRLHNLGIVAHYLVDNGPSSRSQIADGTGLTRGSVTALTAALLDAQVISEAAPLEPTGKSKGRPLTLLSLAADGVALLALQLDADQVTALVTTIDGTPLLRISEHHGRPMGQPDLILDHFAAVLSRTLDSDALRGRRLADVTVVVFAPVAGDPAYVIADTDLAWGTVDVVGGLRSREPRLPVFTRLSPDSTLAAVAERSQLTDVRTMLYLKSNSGIGGAVIVDGAPITGAHGFAGALGHLAVVPGGRLCGCGQHGCLDTVAGPDFLLAEVGLEDLLISDGLTAALDELTRRILNGEPRATAAWDAAASWIAHTVQMLVMTIDPEVVVLGGYWASLAETVASKVADLRPVVPGAVLLEQCPTQGGVLGADAALLGAIWSARDRLLLDPLQLAP